MEFGEFPCEAAEGVVLAHTLKVGGRTLKKGHVLGAGDLAWLRQAGIAAVAGARLEAGELAEDAAAGAVAALLGGADTQTELRPPYTGRCNLHAAVHGVLQVDVEAIDRLNLVDEAVTIATLPQHAVVRPGQVVASVKIIPFGLPASRVEACRARLTGRPPLRVAPLAAHRVALILSELPEMQESIFRGTIAATRHRVEALGSRLALVLRCCHDRHAIEAMLRQALAAGCDLVLVCGATVAKDRQDIAPAAIAAAGGAIEHFGMPVEPGNMLVLGRVGDVPVVILPGCGRSRRSNGLDRVLQRLLAGLAPTREDIMRMGVGGLIRSPLEAQDDGDARDEPAARPPGKSSGPRVAALVLAAGRSSRMGADNKLLAEVDRIPMALRAVNAARASRAACVVAVVGHQAAAVGALLSGSGATIVHNPDYAQGMSTSLRRGLAALPEDVEAALVVLGDMPRISAGHLDRLIAAFDPADPAIVVPERDGRRGNPVLWPREFFAAMEAVSGDQGARGLLEQHAGRIRRVTLDDDAIFLDVDRPEDLRQANSEAIEAQREWARAESGQ